MVICWIGERTSARNEQERIAAEIRRKQAEEQDEIKGYVREYSFAIMTSWSSQKLLKPEQAEQHQGHRLPGRDACLRHG